MWMVLSFFLYLTLHEVQSRHAVPRQRCVEAPAHLTRHILADVLPQQGFYVFGYELSSDNQALVAVDRALRAQLGHHELEQVVGVTSHGLADL